MAPDGGPQPRLASAALYQLGGVLIGFTVPGDAERWRQVLAHHGSPQADSIVVVPVSETLLRRRAFVELGSLQGRGDLSFEDDVVIIDPTDDQMAALVLLEDILAGQEDPERLDDPRGLLHVAVTFNLERLRARMMAQVEVARRRPGGRAQADNLIERLDNLSGAIGAIDKEHTRFVRENLRRGRPA